MYVCANCGAAEHHVLRAAWTDSDGMVEELGPEDMASINADAIASLENLATLCGPGKPLDASLTIHLESIREMLQRRPDEWCTQCEQTTTLIHGPDWVNSFVEDRFGELDR